MPFAIDTMEEEKKKQEASAGTNGANISGTATSTNLPGQNAPQAKGPSKSGQFQNIQKYLSANQPQAEKMATDVANKVESEVGQATQAGESLKGSVQNVGAYNPGDLLGNLGNATEEQKQAYKTTKETGGYSGPSDVTGLTQYNPFKKEAEEAQNVVGQAGSETGQQELLKNIYARPQYSKGMNALDQALLAQSDAGRSKITDIGQKYGQIGSFLSGQEQAAQQAIEQSKQAALANKAAFSPAEQQAQQAIMNPIQQRAAQANTEADKYKAYSQDVSDLALSPETMAALGLSSGQRIFDLNLGNYINQALSPATVQNVATSDERQRYNQLMDFLGQNAGDLSLNAPEYTMGGVDKERLAADLAKKQNEFDTFAAGKRYSYDTGLRNFSDDITTFPVGSTGNIGLSEYLAGNPINMTHRAIVNGDPSSWSNILNPFYAQTDKQARDNIMNQINADLEAYKYNNKIRGQ